MGDRPGGPSGVIWKAFALSLLPGPPQLPQGSLLILLSLSLSLSSGGPPRPPLLMRGVGGLGGAPSIFTIAAIFVGASWSPPPTSRGKIRPKHSTSFLSRGHDPWGLLEPFGGLQRQHPRANICAQDPWRLAWSPSRAALPAHTVDGMN